ncbi:MAG: hypothetical protein ABS80_01840 [Pseudonocardia sp. SCN 72-51]|nr:MAG: hypothetical protein ABS80_01840 [Pseudonocardia sp. SCN 72-51]
MAAAPQLNALAIDRRTTAAYRAPDPLDRQWLSFNIEDALDEQKELGLLKPETRGYNLVWSHIQVRHGAFRALELSLSGCEHLAQAKLRRCLSA